MRSTLSHTCVLTRVRCMCEASLSAVAHVCVRYNDVLHVCMYTMLDSTTTYLCLLRHPFKYERINLGSTVHKSCRACPSCQNYNLVYYAFVVLSSIVFMHTCNTPLYRILTRVTTLKKTSLVSPTRVNTSHTRPACKCTHGSHAMCATT